MINTEPQTSPAIDPAEWNRKIACESSWLCREFQDLPVKVKQQTLRYLITKSKKRAKELK